MNHFVILLVFIAGIGLTAGDVIVKKWATTGNSIYYVIGMVAYLIAIAFLAESFKYKNMAIANSICVGLNVVTLVIVSWFYFKETLSILQLLGILLIIIGIVVLELT